MVSMLVRSPTQDLVEYALDGLSKNSAPGADEAQASIYSAFREFFVPLMHDIYQHILNTGELNPEWSQAILNPIPKSIGQCGCCRPQAASPAKLLPQVDIRYPAFAIARPCFCCHTNAPVRLYQRSLHPEHSLAGV